MNFSFVSQDDSLRSKYSITYYDILVNIKSKIEEIKTSKKVEPVFLTHLASSHVGERKSSSSESEEDEHFRNTSTESFQQSYGKDRIVEVIHSRPRTASRQPLQNSMHKSVSEIVEDVEKEDDSDSVDYSSKFFTLKITKLFTVALHSDPTAFVK